MLTPRFETLIEMLEARARKQPELPAFRFAGRDTTFGELWRATGRFASCLLARGLVRGDRAVLALPNGGEFFTAFYGVQRAGGVAVPIFPDSGAERIGALADLCGARKVVVSPGASPQTRERLERLAAEGAAAVLEVADSDPFQEEGDFPAARAGDLSYLQYTSGSTGNPKGVEITHAMATVNLEQLIAGMGITADEVFVSWLPVCHDMGLVLMTMVPFALGAKLVLLPASLTHVRRWLEAIERHRATFTAAPDFAYRLCLRRIRDPRDFDLSSLRVALNAAEPVRRRTVAEFHEAFGLTDVMAPGYGLAEATVGVSMRPPRTPVKVDGRGFVAVGRPFPGIDLQVLAGDEPAAAGEVGEIAIKSPANTPGYYRNPRATAELFWRGGPSVDWIRTGDLGYVDTEGDLFIVGRQKNVIIHGGRNLAPGELEEIVDRLPFVRRSAAVGIDRGRLEGEQAYVFAEVRRAPAGLGQKAELKAPIFGAELEQLAVEVVRALHGELGFRPGRVYLLRPRAIPLTPNGKIQHAALKARYLDGRLREEGWIRFPEY